jgi:serine/threonine protein kinase
MKKSGKLGQASVSPGEEQLVKRAALIDQARIEGAQKWDIGPKYVYEKALGSGAYAAVCQAKCTQSAEKVAIKKFTNIYSDMDVCKRGLRELELLYAFDHPCIIRPKELILRPGSSDLYVVLELARTDLRKLSHSPVFLEAKQIKLIMYQILVSLNYIHSGGVVHRDIKPGNVLVNEDSTVKLCDFSISRCLSGLESSQFDCDTAIRQSPSLNQSSTLQTSSMDHHDHSMSEGAIVLKWLGPDADHSFRAPDKTNPLPTSSPSKDASKHISTT